MRGGDNPAKAPNELPGVLLGNVKFLEAYRSAVNGHF